MKSSYKATLIVAIAITGLFGCSASNSSATSSITATSASASPTPVYDWKDCKTTIAPNATEPVPSTGEVIVTGVFTSSDIKVVQNVMIANPYGCYRNQPTNLGKVTVTHSKNDTVYQLKLNEGVRFESVIASLTTKPGSKKELCGYYPITGTLTFASSEPCFDQYAHSEEPTYLRLEFVVTDTNTVSTVDSVDADLYK